VRPVTLVVALAALTLVIASCSVKTELKAGDTSSTDEAPKATDTPDEKAAEGPTVKAMRVGDTYDEEKQVVSNELDEFPPDTPEIHMDADLGGLAPGSTLTATLTAVKVITPDGKELEDEKVNSIDYAIEKPDTGVHAKFTAPDAGWPTGEYVIALTVGDDVLEESEFTVTAGDSPNEPKAP